MKYYSLVFFVLLGFIAGCGNKQVGWSGTVVFSDDGSPVPRGVVIFSTPTFQSHGDIVEGKFTMSSYGPNDGLPPGTYDVTITAIDGEEMGSLYNLIDLKYGNPATSGLKTTVDKTVKNHEFKVDRNTAPRPK